MVEGFRHFPGLSLFLGLVLYVAFRHIETDRIAKDHIVDLFGRNVLTTHVHRDHQFDLMMQIAGARRIRHGFAILQDRTGGLHEEERRVGLGICAHLFRVRPIILADAIDAPHRKRFGRHRHERDNWRLGEGIIAHGVKPLLWKMPLNWRRFMRV